MPTSTSYASGSLLLFGSPGGVASGTLTETLTAPAAPGIASGTLDEDESLGAAFDVTGAGVSGGRTRVVGARVELDGVAAEGVVGTLNVDTQLGNLVRAASFELATPKVAYYHPSSYSNGEKACLVYLLAGRPGRVQEWLAFTGKTESAPNSGAYRPRATFQASGNGADWQKRTACLRVPAFGGYTTGRVISEYASLIGVTLSGDVASMGRVLQRPIEVMKIPLDELVKRIGEVEGWTLRINPDDTVEILTDEQLADGPVVIDFDETNLISVAETPPARPVTRWTLTSTQIDAPVLEEGQRTDVVITGGIGEDGKPYQAITEITTEYGTPVFTRVRQFSWIAPDGDPPLAEGLYEVSRVDTTSNYQRNDFPDGSSRYSTRLNSRVIETYALTGVPCASDYSGTVYTWAGGGFYTTPAAALTLISRITETDEWDATTCSLKLQTTVAEELYSPLVDPSTGHPYSDGKYRAAESWSLVTKATTKIRYDDWRRENIIPQLHRTDLVTRYAVSGHVAAAGGFPEQDVETYHDAERIVESWIGNASGTGGTHNRNVIWPQMTNADGKTLESLSEPFSGPVPGPPSGSVAIPQLTQHVIGAVFDATAILPWSEIRGAEVLEWAETPEVLLWAAARRINKAMEVEYLLSSRDYPGLDVGNCSRFRDVKRSITTPVKGYVTRVIRERKWADNGACGGNMHTVVRVPTNPVVMARPA